MKRLWIIVLLLLSANTCGEVSDPYSQIAQGQVALTQTAAARAADSLAAQMTIEAQRGLSKEAAATMQAIAAEQTDAEWQATGTPQAADLLSIHATAAAVELQMTQAAEGKYGAALATAEMRPTEVFRQEEIYQQARSRDRAFVTLVVLIAIMAVVWFGALLFLLTRELLRTVQARRRIVEAEAYRAGIDAKRSALIETRAGTVHVDGAQPTIIGRTPEAMQTTQFVSDAGNAATIQGHTPSELEQFILDAIALEGEAGTVIPSHVRMEYGGQKWYKLVNVLRAANCLGRVDHNGTELDVDLTLGDLLQDVRRGEIA